MIDKNIDQITLDIIQDSLAAAGEEMFLSVARSSKSPVIYEVLDFASAIMDDKGNMLTQGNGVTAFIGMLSGMAKEVLKKYHAVGKMYPGDIFISNDPYSGGGSHLSDVGMVKPIFFEGELVAMAVAKAHWTEVGGKEKGSWSVDAKEIYQEGVQFANLKICHGGEMDENLLEIIRANVRFPDQSLGDMWSQVAGLNTAEKRIMEICRKFGVDTVKLAIGKLLRNSAEEVRQKLLSLPEGTYEGHEFVESDGLGTTNINIDVKVTIKDGKFIVDFTGTHAQVPGPINLPYSVLVSLCRFALIAATNITGTINDGMFECLEIISESGSIVNAKRPASVGICWETMLPALDAIMHALVGILPDKFVASNASTVGSFILACVHPELGTDALNVAPTLLGLGAGQGHEGQNAQFCYCDGETFLIPSEVLESRYGFRVLEYGLNDGVDAGAGEWRGGLGIRRRYQMRSDGCYFTGAYGRSVLKPWGCAGGQDGSNSYYEVEYADGSKTEPKGMAARVRLDKGDVLKVTTGSGGGYGDPLRRSTDKVAMDVKNEYITPEIAEKTFGVICSADGEILGISKERMALSAAV